MGGIWWGGMVGGICGVARLVEQGRAGAVPVLNSAKNSARNGARTVTPGTPTPGHPDTRTRRHR